MADDLAPERERSLRQVLAAFEAGRLEPDEYAARVLAINAATTEADMAAAAGSPTEGAVPPDAVDLALLRRAAAPTRSPAPRYAALVLVFVLFAVLLGLGIWLSSRVHAVSAGSTGTLVAVVAAPARAG
ncbi:MAG TPA: DUF1707 domain-containing protein [Acidimicrobiales bacterium]|nr:DUF1707 domain-containing protein [Acidimicrobiales bacterium]